MDPSASDSNRARGESSRSVPTAEEEDPVPQLPLAMLLEIVQRSDLCTLVRCAATHNLLRSAILATPALRRRIRVDPDNLLGFSFWQHTGGRRAIDTPPLLGLQRLVRLDDGAITGFGPVAWRHGLLVIRRFRLGSHDLRVCNALTGDVTDSLPHISLPVEPSPSLCRMRWRCPQSFSFVLLTTTGRSFELLATNMGMQTQLFSSDRWEWGPVRVTSFPQHHHPADLLYRYFSRPAVIGRRTIYWLCSASPSSCEPPPVPRHDHLEILSLDVGAAEATLTELPPYCTSDMVFRPGPQFNTRALLAAVRGGQLCLFVLEKYGISACTIVQGLEPPTWSRQFVITRPELEARAALAPRDFTRLRLHAYGERSGSMILELSPCVFLRLDIGEDFSVARVLRLGTRDSQATNAIFLALHEQ